MALTLVPLRQEDVPLALSFIQEAGTWAPRTPYNADPLAALGAANAVWLTALNGDEVVGIAGAHSISFPDRSADLAVGTTSKWRGKGVGTLLARALIDYCFRILDLIYLSVTTTADSPSAKIATRVGMVLEGRHKQARNRDGQRVDVLTFGLLRGATQ